MFIKSKQNKTYDYLFRPYALTMLNGNTYYKLKKLIPTKYSEKQLFEEYRVYLCDKDIDGADIEDGIFYIVCDTRCPSYHTFLEYVKGNDLLYIDNYACGTVNSTKSVIRMKFLDKDGERLKAFLDSKYSFIYPRGNKDVFGYYPDYFLMKAAVKDEYTKKDDQGNPYLEDCWHIMTHSNDYFRRICEAFNIDSKEDKLNVWKNEFGDKLDYEKEMFNSKLL